jgi:hypothetical protein
MRRNRVVPVLCLALVFVLTTGLTGSSAADAPPSQDGTLPALTAIAGAGMIGSHAYSNLEELSDDIGPRVTGSPGAAKAVEWGVAKMKAMGLVNVRAEKWQIDRGWTRGAATAELLSPVRRPLVVDAMGWVGSTPASGADGDVVQVDASKFDQEVKDNTLKWSGKILLVRQPELPPAPPFGPAPPRPQQRPAAFNDFLRAAEKAHALAIIGGQGGSMAQGMRITHTGALGYNTRFDIPVVSMTAEDQQQLQRFLNRKQPVRLHINVQNEFSSGRVDSANVVGEIRGTEHPEQIVVVGGHLDSWDLAQGTTDDGTGVVTTLGAAEAIMKSGFKPKRTIRFVLFTGEEQGLLGSLNYTKMHKDEMQNHVAAVILDSGQGPVVRLAAGHDDVVPAIKQFLGDVNGFGEMTVNDGVTFGTDSGPFVLAGVPGITMGQDSPEYRYTHHSAVDTFDKVKPDIMARDSTIMALTSFWIASRPDRLGSPWPAEKTARMLVEKHQDESLKAEGIWPFGDLGKDAKKKEGQ